MCLLGSDVTALPVDASVPFLPYFGEIHHRRSNQHDPKRRGRNRIGKKPPLYLVDGALIGAVQESKNDKYPRRTNVKYIDRMGQVQVHAQSIECHRDFKQIFEIVRGIQHGGGKGNLEEIVTTLGIGQIVHCDTFLLVLGYVPFQKWKALIVQVEPYHHRQLEQSQEWTKDGFLLLWLGIIVVAHGDGNKLFFFGLKEIHRYNLPKLLGLWNCKYSSNTRQNAKRTQITRVFGNIPSPRHKTDPFIHLVIHFPTKT
jgi:hypothetical protein